MLEAQMGEINESPNGELNPKDVSGFHSNLTHIVFCDGHLRHVSANTEFKIWHGSE